MSAACCSGESSSPNDAWIPPCALAELQAWIEPFVASADARARALGGHRGGEPGGAAADHEHVEGVRVHGVIIPTSIIPRISRSLSIAVR